MIILEKPYVSDVLLKAMEKLQVPILKNEMVEQVKENYKLKLIDEKEFLKQYREDGKLYTNSENSLDWIYKNIVADEKIQTIKLFKNKAAFRNVVKEIYPDFFYQTVSYEKLCSFDISKIKLPIILKPNQGFFSLGVYTIYSKEDWENALAEISIIVKADDNPFNEDVISHTEYIIEEYIVGEEYAVDGYYDANGNVVVLNILKHIFASETDVSDRLYITSIDIIKKYFNALEIILSKVNKDKKIINFPFHFEVRIDGEHIVPIEMNPLRFAGWCTTDIAYYSYGISTYECFFKNEKPDWELIFKNNKDVVYAMVIMDKSTKDENKDEIFNYKKLNEQYSEILEIRQVDYNINSIYGFMFLKIKEEQETVFEKILQADFDLYLECK